MAQQRRDVLNALLLEDGKIAATRFKHDLPNYGVFDEVRVFEAGPMPGPMDLKVFGSVCRFARTYGRRMYRSVSRNWALRSAGAERLAL